MVRNIKELNNDYLSMRIKMFNTVAIGTLILSIISVVISIVSQIGSYAWVLSALCSGAIIIMIIIINLSRAFEAGSLLLSLVINIILFPTLFFTNGGNTGAIPLFFLIGILFSIIVLKGVALPLITGIEIAFYIILIWIGFLDDTVIKTIDSIIVRNIHLSIGLILASVIAGNICRSLITQNKKERIRIDNLLKKDPLTKVYNRRYLMEVIHYYMEHKEFHPLALTIFDVDNFKKVNDQFGHVEGDQVLRNLGKVLFENSDDMCIAGRYGGEEFVLVMPNFDTNRAYYKSCNVCNKVAESVGVSSKVTCSGGISVFKPGETIEHFIAEADSNLYYSKTHGKNQVTFTLPKSGRTKF